MKKIDKAIASALKAGQALKMGNTHTDGQNVWLFGNLIATKGDHIVTVNFCGWPTVTTKSRINAILGVLDVPSQFHIVKGQLKFSTRYLPTAEPVSYNASVASNITFRF